MPGGKRAKSVRQPPGLGRRRGLSPPYDGGSRTVTDLGPSMSCTSHVVDVVGLGWAGRPDWHGRFAVAGVMRCAMTDRKILSRDNLDCMPLPRVLMVYGAILSSSHFTLLTRSKAASW